MKKWLHPFIKGCYCYERNGKVYTYINHKRQKTDLYWVEENKESALQMLNYRIEENRNSYVNSLDAYTLSKLADEFLEIKTKELTKKTYQGYMYAIQYFFVKEHNIQDVQGIRAMLLQQLKVCKFKKRTISLYLTKLSALFNYAISNGYMSYNPISKQMIPKGFDNTFETFTIQELEKFIELLKNTHIETYYVVKFIRLTGCRIDECLKLRSKDIQPEHVKIQGKGGRERYIPLTPFPEIKEFLKEIPIQNRDYLFQMTRENYVYHFKTKLKSLYPNYSSFLFHSVRKARENELIDDGRLELRLVASMMGHTIQVQEQHYMKRLKPDELNKLIMKRFE